MKAQEKRQRYDETAKLFMDIVDTKVNDVTRENANMNADTPSGMMMKFASETTKNFALDYLIDEEIAQAHKEGIIHIHDLDYYVTKSLTCLQHPLDKILKNGFRAGHGSSRSAKSIRTASMLACISLETNQNEMHGGQAIPAWDFYMAPYVKKTFRKELEKSVKLLGVAALIDVKRVDVEEYVYKPLESIEDLLIKAIQFAVNETVDQTHQAMEAFIHNMNTIHSRGGNQVVFSSINYGTDTSAEGRLVMRELLEATYKGVGNGETPIFPIQIFKIKDGVNFKESDPNYDLYKLACKVTARRLFPNFVNLDAPFNTHEGWRADDPLRYLKEVSTMGCRTRTFEDRHGGKTPVGRGNLSFTTVNLPKLAIEASLEGGNVTEVFYKKLTNAMDLAFKQLYKRYEFQATAKAKQFPLLMNSLWKDGENLGPNDSVKEVLKHGTLSIGYIGLAEALVMLIGKHHGESKDAQKLGLQIVGYMDNKIKEYGEKCDLNFSLLATPAESLAGRAAKRDRVKYGIIEGVTDREYYTNSNHVPVYFKCTAKKKLEIEAPYHALTLAGHISYVELDGDATHNVEAIDAIVKLAHKLNIGYLSINHNRTRCLSCGYEGADAAEAGCPSCGSDNLDILARITGYLVGSLGKWNGGKTAEWKDRVTHN